MNNFTEAQWDKILGKWAETDIEADKIPALWKQLEDLPIEESSSSLHVCHAVFILENVRYACYWNVNDTTEVPIQISIQSPRKPIAAQKELF